MPKQGKFFYFILSYGVDRWGFVCYLVPRKLRDMKSIFKNNQFLKDLQDKLLVDVQDKYNNKAICKNDVWRELQMHTSEFFRTNLSQHISEFHAGRKENCALADFSFDDNDNNKFIVNVKTYFCNPASSRIASVKKLLNGDKKDGFDGLKNPKHFYMIVSFDYDIHEVNNCDVKPTFYACHVFPICSYVAKLKQKGKIGAAGEICLSRNTIGQLNYMPEKLEEEGALDDTVSREDWLKMVRARINKDYDAQIALLEKDKGSLWD